MDDNYISITNSWGMWIAFSNAVWAMSIGCIFNLIMVAFFTPHIMKLKDKIAGGDQGWLKVMTSAANWS
jgi:hypothetical protein